MISSLFPARDSRLMLIDDLYDPTYNPTGNLFANGLLAGSGGTPSNGVTGTGIADGWTVYAGGGTV